MRQLLLLQQLLLLLLLLLSLLLLAAPLLLLLSLLLLAAPLLLLAAPLLLLLSLLLLAAPLLPRKHENKALSIVLTPNTPSRLRATHAPERRFHAREGLAKLTQGPGVTRSDRRKPGWLRDRPPKVGKGGREHWCSLLSLEKNSPCIPR